MMELKTVSRWNRNKKKFKSLMEMSELSESGSGKWQIRWKIIGQVKSVCNCGFGYASAELEGCQEDKD